MHRGIAVCNKAYACAILLLCVCASCWTALESSWSPFLDMSSNPTKYTTSGCHTGWGNAEASTGATAAGFDVVVETARRFTFGLNEAPAAVPRRRFDVRNWTHKADGGLSDADREMLGRVYGRAGSVFEFGLGESTLIADAVQVPKYAGVDSDPEWVAATRQKVDERFRFYLADIGETSEWGRPSHPNATKAVWDYQLAPLLSEPEPFDVYLVDGRYRLPCLLVSFLHASRNRPTVAISARADDPGDSGAIVLMHDCRNRSHYHRADDLLDLVETSTDGRLCAYQRKPNTTDRDLSDRWHRHMSSWK
jgi:hypothetical protein